jgi:ketosteroid isomerase-like protein
MTNRNEALVGEAYEAYGRGDVAGMLEFVDPGLEWTYLNPAFENPEPETCHGRDQLQLALERQAEQRQASQIEEIAASGDKVMVVIRTPGIDDERVRQAEDRNYMVLTLDRERIIRMRACRNRDESRTGRITAAYPFSALPTAHRVQIAGGASAYAMCAIDALGIAPMLGGKAVMQSADPSTGQPVTVTVD